MKVNNYVMLKGGVYLSQNMWAYSKRYTIVLESYNNNSLILKPSKK